MKDKFLKAKHWQIFLLTFGIPVIFQFVMMASILSGILLHPEPDINTIFNFMKFFPVIMIIFLSGFFGWFWAVAIGLQHKIPENVTMNPTKFKIFFFIPVIYILCISVFLGTIMSDLLLNQAEPSQRMIALFAGIIIPIHLFSMFCIFYLLYFVAKTFKTAELQRKVVFSDFAGEFFMIWFFPVGIWIIQPKINKMVE